MAGKYNEMQAHILKTNDLAKYILINLIGVLAASNNVEMVSFFGVIQKLFNFLSSYNNNI